MVTCEMPTHPFVVRAQHVLAGVVIAVRRRLGDVVSLSAPDATVNRQKTVADLRAEVLGGSSWSALCLCLKTWPDSLRELLREVGVPGEQHRPGTQVFDACVDGYVVYEDARHHGRVGPT